MTSIHPPQEINQSLIHGFMDSVRRVPGMPALEVDGASFTYEELWQKAGAIAAFLRSEVPEPLIAVLGAKNLSAYTGILGVLIAGKGYVPLNPKYPVERLARMLCSSGCRTLVIGSQFEELARKIVCALEEPMLVICADGNGIGLRGAAPTLAVVARDDLPPTTAWGFPQVAGDAVAYLLFTSGSTGIPKGVPITHANVAAYLEYTSARYELGVGDRCSQTFDLTFDLSVHDMFLCWGSGATLCPVPPKIMPMPAQFIRERKLTEWFSVPSAALLMARSRLLKAAAFPSLRWSLFCGEALPAELASAWQSAACNSTVENLYGPTEATIAITHYRWNQQTSPGECRNGTVPIGSIFKTQRFALIGATGNPIGDNTPGELCLGGSQVASSYWHDERLSAMAFRSLAGLKGKWYCTGDLAQQDEQGCLYFLGRKDHQIKIGGFRVELQEVELVVREVAQADQAIALAWPVGDANPTGIVAVLGGVQTCDSPAIISACRRKLPAYMAPQEVYCLGEFPRNENGKVDRRRIAEMLMQRA